MKKRLLAGILTLCMMLTLIPAAGFAADTNSFEDVKAGDWFYDAVLYVKDKGLMSGMSDTTFAPNDNTTRGMIVTILWRLAGTPAATGTQFDDVDDGQYYADAVLWAAANAVVNGYGDGSFGPNDMITREQLAAILYRYAAQAEYDVEAQGDLAAFTDADEVSAWATEALSWAVASALINGMDDGTLAPKSNATRAQVAAILSRYCEPQIDTPDDSEPGENNADEEPAGENTADTYTVTFDLNYSNQGVYETVSAESGKTVESPENPKRYGYSFRGWYTEASGGEKFDFNTEITADITLYAQWNGGGSGGSSSGSVGGGHSHDWSYIYNGDGTHDKVCSKSDRCGDTGIACKPVYTANNNGTHVQACKDCDYEETVTCTYEDVNGVQTCDCGHTFELEEGKNVVISKPATGEEEATVDQYATFEDAFAAAGAGEVITVMSGNIDLSQTLTVDKNVTISGNGAEGVTITAPAEGGSIFTVDNAKVESEEEEQPLVEITLDGVTIADADASIVEVPEGNAGVTVNVKNSSLKSLNNIDVKGEDCVVNITDSTLEASEGGSIITVSGNDTEINLYGTNTFKATEDGVGVSNPHQSDGVTGAAALNNYGTLTIDGGKYVNENIDAQKAMVIKNEGTLIINDGIIGSDLNRGAAIENHGGTVTINGGTFATMDRTHSSNGYAYVFINYEGTMTIENATVDGNPNGIFYAYAGTITVNDGYYAIGDGAANTWYVAYAQDDSVIELNGGEYVWKKPAWNTIEPITGDVETAFAVYCQLYGLTYKADGFALDAEGNGMISTATGLKAFADSVNTDGATYAGKTITLSADIDLNNEAWTPIGTTEALAFKGTFDGGNKVISNLTVTGTDALGLFGWVKGEGALKNIKIKNVSITGGFGLGAVAGIARGGSIQDCSVTGDIRISGTYQTGGLAGQAYTDITNCTVTGDTGSFVKATYTTTENREGDNAGGIVGFFGEHNHTLSGCSATIDVEGTRKVGGIAGYIGPNSTVSGCSYSGDVLCNADSDYVSANAGKLFVGGIVGESGGKSGGTSSVTNCTVATGSTVTGKESGSTGAVLGGSRKGSEYTTVSDCVSDGVTVTYPDAADEA